MQKTINIGSRKGSSQIKEDNKLDIILPLRALRVFLRTNGKGKEIQ